ncbi:MAG: XRE family transcriptional regulator [Flavobacteriales bacterium]
MKTTQNFRAQIIENPMYWVEGINGMLYDAIVRYMEKHQMKQKDLAKHLGISPGRVSQILNDGNINFSIEKIIEIAIKVDKIPNFIFEDKSTFLEGELKKTTRNDFKLAQKKPTSSALKKKYLAIDAHNPNAL